jgi:type IV pilus assembly protein PilM
MFYIGIALEADAFRVAVLKKEKKTVLVESLHTFPYGPDNVKLFYNLPPFHTGKETLIVSGIAASETFIRKLHIPLKDKRKILSALPFQLESLIPFCAEDPILCALLKPLSKQMTSVTAIATTKDHLSFHLSELKKLDIVADAVSCAPTALMRLGRWKFSGENKILGFDFRAQKLTCVVYEGKEIVLSQTLPAQDQDEVFIELEKLAVFLKQKGAIEENTPWLLTGTADFLQTSSSIVLTERSIAEQIAKIFPGKMLELEPPYATYALAIGFALDALEHDEMSVQFCQKQYTPLHTLLNRKKKALHYLALCFASAFLVAAGGSLMLHKKQKTLVDRLHSCLPPSLSNDSFFSLEEIEEKLSQWEKSVKGQKSNFAFLPNVPKVSDVLAWLSSHPAFTNEDGSQKEGIEIKSLHYSLTKYPKIGEASTPYLAQLELEFSSQTPRTARDFHDELLKGDQIVNPKKEIKWQTQNQKYQTAFELNKGVPK